MFCYYKLICDNLYTPSQVHSIYCFMALPNDMLCAYAINYTWDTTTEMTCLIGNNNKSLPISNMDITTINQGTLE